MKRMFAALFVLLFSVGCIWAQVNFSPDIESIESQSSRSLFLNEIDNTVNPSMEFYEFDSSYLFGGLTNLWVNPDADQTANATSGNPYWAGFYKAGEMPWSAFAGLFHDDASTLNGDETQVTTGTDTIVNGTTTTNEEYTATKTSVTYSGGRISDRITDQFQFLINIGSFITGLYVDLDLIDNTDLTVTPATSTPALDGSANYEVSYTENYASTVDPVAADTIERNFTAKTTETSLDKDSTYNFIIPFFMPTGEMEHLARLLVGFNSYNLSTSYSQDYTAPEDTAAASIGAAGTDTLADDEDNTGLTTTIALAYGLTMPGFFGDEDNEFMAGVELDLNLHSSTYTYDFHTKDYTFTGGGNETLAGEDIEEAEVSSSGIFDFGIETSAAHSFNYEMGNSVMFKVQPGLTVGFSSRPSAGDVEIDSVDATVLSDSNGDGTYDATDQEITYDYTNTVGVNPTTGAITTEKDKQTDISVSFSCPMALQFKPEKWIFGVTMGSEPQINFTNSKTTTFAASRRTTIVDNLAGTTTITETTPTDETVSIDRTWTVRAIHQIGFWLDLNENVRIDFLMNGADLLDFSDLTLQAIIALP